MRVNPDILIWARATAGLPLEQAAHALGFNDTRDRTAIERLQAMEAGEDHPGSEIRVNCSPSSV